MDDEEYEVQASTARQFIKADLWPLTLGLLEGLLGALHSASVTAYNVAARHANFMHQQDAFRKEAALEIETITAEPTDG